MPRIVRDFTPLIPTSSGSSVTNSIGHLDDAHSLMIYITSSAATASTGASPLRIQVSYNDPADVTSTFITYSGPLSTGAGIPVLTTGQAYSLFPVPFRGLRLTNLTSAVLNEVVAVVTKQITV